MKFVAVFLFSMLLVSELLASDDLVVHTTPVNPKHSDLHELIIKAYKNLDVPVVFTSLPYTRGLVSANYGAIDAVDLRFESHASHYDNLVKVDYPVYIGKTYLVIDKNSCKNCSLKDVLSVASVSGYNVASFFEDAIFAKMTVQEFAEHRRLFKFFDRQRVQSMLVGDIFLPEKYRDNERFSLFELGSHKVYHYLNQKHEGLAKRLERSFRRLNQQYAENLPEQTENTKTIGASSATSVSAQAN